MANKILDKSSVEYLRTDIEHDQLFSENTEPLTIVDAADLVEVSTVGQELKFHTTGNGIVYLSGRAVIQQAISNGTALLTIPDRMVPVFTKILQATLFSAPTYSVEPLVLVGNTISAGNTFGVLNDLLILDGIFYLTG